MKLDFPDITKDWHTYSCVPLYFEPIKGSGERVLAGIVLCDGADVTAYPVAPEASLHQQFGPMGKQFHAAIKELLEDARETFKPGHASSIERFSALYRSAAAGEPFSTAGKSLDDASARALRKLSYLNVLLAPVDQADIPDKPAIQQRHAKNRVLELLRERSPAMESRVRVRIQVSPADSGTTLFDFVGDSLAAEIHATTRPERSPAIERSIFHLSKLERSPRRRSKQALFMLSQEAPSRSHRSNRRMVAVRNEIRSDCMSFGLAYHEHSTAQDVVDHVAELETA